MPEHEPTEFPRTIGKVAERELSLNGYRTWTDLARTTERELRAIHGIGPKAVRILHEELVARGMSFRD